MTARVWRDGDQIRKRVSDETSARRLVSRTDALRAGDVPTPQAWFDTRDGTLVFQLIEGTAGLVLVKNRGVPVDRKSVV